MTLMSAPSSALERIRFAVDLEVTHEIRRRTTCNDRNAVGVAVCHPVKDEAIIPREREVREVITEAMRS